MKNKKLYICTGENFVNGYGVGSCGSIKTINDWIIFLYGKNALDFFQNDTVQKKIDYIYKFAGKRLKIYER